MTVETEIATIAARWRRMDADSAALVLRNTAWIASTDAPPVEPVEPMGGWGAVTPEELSTEERAARVAWTVMTHDPRFARQLGRLTSPPFSEDFQEFVYLLLADAARIGALYAKHVDEHEGVALDVAARAAAALLDVELLTDPPAAPERD